MKKLLLVLTLLMFASIADGSKKEVVGWGLAGASFGFIGACIGKIESLGLILQGQLFESNIRFGVCPEIVLGHKIKNWKDIVSGPIAQTALFVSCLYCFAKAVEIIKKEREKNKETKEYPSLDEILDNADIPLLYSKS